MWIRRAGRYSLGGGDGVEGAGVGGRVWATIGGRGRERGVNTACDHCDPEYKISVLNAKC